MLGARVVRASIRQFSSAANSSVKYGRDFNTTWFGDKGAWPVIGVLGCAVGLCATFIGRKTLFHPDVRISSNRRRADIRDW